MAALDPARLIAAASAMVGITEEGPDNHGQVVELFLREVGLPAGVPWCAAFVSHVGYWSHYDHGERRSSWPLPRTASCAVLGEFASAHGALVEAPEAGDLFLRYSKARGRFAHVGVVVRAARADRVEQGVTCLTIEGNTNTDGSANGRAVLLRNRRLTSVAGDRFVRWAALAAG